MGAFLAGTLVAVHPIVVEQLMIIAGRAEIFGLLMTLLTLYFMLRPGRRNAVLGAGSFVVALFFKESAVIIPVLLALCLWMKKSPRAAYSGFCRALSLMLPYFWLRAHAVGRVLFAHDPEMIAQFFIIAFPHVLWTYARLIVFPWNLHSHHMVPRLSHIWSLYLLSLPCLSHSFFTSVPAGGFFAIPLGFDPVPGPQNTGHDFWQFHAGALGLSGAGWRFFFSRSSSGIAERRLENTE